MSRPAGAADLADRLGGDSAVSEPAGPGSLGATRAQRSDVAWPTRERGLQHRAIGLTIVRQHHDGIPTGKPGYGCYRRAHLIGRLPEPAQQLRRVGQRRSQQPIPHDEQPRGRPQRTHEQRPASGTSQDRDLARSATEPAHDLLACRISRM